MRRAALLTIVVWRLCFAALASDLDEFKVKREPVFEFTKGPTVLRRGDRVTVTFATKGRCDVTVAIEEPGGRIVRHLACGVLGKNAPPPFHKNALQQMIVWDGKDDQGRYIDDKDSLVVRVSLGLRPRFERSLLWEPRRRVTTGHSPGTVGYPAPIMAAAKEGVYVYDGGGTGIDHLRLFDHQGNYLRTIYPFPAAKVRAVNGLTWYTYPQDGLSLPLKRTFLQSTLLTSGSNSCITYNAKTGRFCTTFSKSPDHFGMWGHAVHALAVRNGRIIVAHRRINRLAADGSSGGLELEGPDVTFPVKWYGSYASGGGYRAAPRSAALSPDGRWLYLTGYLWDRGYYDGLHGVVRVRLEGNAKPEVFAGSMKPRDRGTERGRFWLATSVACDRKGRVYVTDYMNDRVQVFDAAGKHLRSIPSSKPAHVAIHQATGEIYVFSWHITSVLLKQQAARLKKQGKELDIPARLTVYGPLENPRPVRSYPIPFEKYSPRVSTYYAHYEGLQYRVCLDSWTDPPTVWLVPNAPGRHDYGRTPPWSKAAIRLLVPKGGKLALKRDFGREAEQWSPPANYRQRLYVNPKTHLLYLANGGDTAARLLEIHPDTGHFRWVTLPLIAEDVAFDQDGLVYLRTRKEAVRYDPVNWRQVPFDYGEQRVLEQNYKKIKILSCIPLPAMARGTFRHGGMWVSPKGRIAVGCLHWFKPAWRRGDKAALTGAKVWAPRLYPGRTTQWVYGSTYVHVWDRHGKVLYEDAAPGINGAHGVGIDNQDGVYVLVAAARALDGKPYFNDATCTLMKFQPGKGRIIAEHGAPIPLTDGTRPKRPPDLYPFKGPAWVDGAEWLYGGVGWSGKKWEGCCCWNARFGLDYFARTFAPETDRYKVAVLDTAGNLILRVGRYGNADDGRPCGTPWQNARKRSAGSLPGEPPNQRSIGGDEVSLFHAPYVAADTDRRLFIADPGNARIVSVTLGYHAEEKIALKDVPDAAQTR